MELRFGSRFNPLHRFLHEQQCVAFGQNTFAQLDVTVSSRGAALNSAQSAECVSDIHLTCRSVHSDDRDIDAKGQPTRRCDAGDEEEDHKSLNWTCKAVRRPHTVTAGIVRACRVN